MGSQLVPSLGLGAPMLIRYRTLLRVDGQNCSLALIFIGARPKDTFLIVLTSLI